MIKNSAMRKLKRSIDKLYDSTCTISGEIEYKKTNGATGFKTGIKAENIKCSISKKDNQNLIETNSVSDLKYSVTMFCDPNVGIKSGDEIEVTFLNGSKIQYLACEPFIYQSHLEVPLIRKDRS